MLLINRISSYLASRSKPTAEVDLPTRIVRAMRREGDATTAEFLSTDLAVEIDKICVALEGLLERGHIRVHGPGKQLQPCVVYALAY